MAPVAREAPARSAVRYVLDNWQCMELPFSHAEFLDVFAAYNAALWPLSIALWLLSLSAFVLVMRGEQNDRAITPLLAVHWGWAAIAYHWAYFAAINPAAHAFAVGFLAQALLLATGAWRGSLRYVRRPPTPRRLIGAVMAAYALAYPALAVLAVGDYPRIPTFGVPCPTTLLTIGFLLMATPVRISLLIVPLLWTIIGGSAALLFGIAPDFALLAAGLVVLMLLPASRRQA
jgi:hypothetical protein